MSYYRAKDYAHGESVPRPVALSPKDCEALKARWNAITKAWLEHATDEETIFWAETFHPEECGR